MYIIKGIKTIEFESLDKALDFTNNISDKEGKIPDECSAKIMVYPIIKYKKCNYL